METPEMSQSKKKWLSKGMASPKIFHHKNQIVGCATQIKIQIAGCFTHYH
jgi:hypothetical protein